MRAAQLSLAAAAVLILVAAVVGAPLPEGARVFATVALGALGMARVLRYGGVFAVGGKRVSQAAVDSDGWRKDSFVMDGLEEDGEALQEYTDEAGMYGYRRERTDDMHSWRFVRDPRS